MTLEKMTDDSNLEVNGRVNVGEVEAEVENNLKFQFNQWLALKDKVDDLSKKTSLSDKEVNKVISLNNKLETLGKEIAKTTVNKYNHGVPEIDFLTQLRETIDQKLNEVDVWFSEKYDLDIDHHIIDEINGNFSAYISSEHDDMVIDFNITGSELRDFSVEELKAVYRVLYNRSYLKESNNKFNIDVNRSELFEDTLN